MPKGAKPNYPLWMIAISLLIITACMVIDSIERRRNHNVKSRVEIVDAPNQAVINRPPAIHTHITRSAASEAPAEKAAPENLPPVEVPGSSVTVLPAAHSGVGGPQPVGYSVSGISASSGQLGVLTGRITLKGTPPTETVLKSNPECSGRTSPVMSRTFVVGESNGLADAVVFFRPGVHTGTVPPPTNTAIVSFTNCEVQPYVTAVMTGQPVSFRDADGMGHQLYLRDNSIKGLQILAPNSERELRFTQPHLFTWVQCLVHSWESAYVCVMETPFFAVTDRNGNFDIPNIPSGKYTVEIAHQRATGTNAVTRTVVVLAGRKTELNVALDVPAH
jgi:hypothetical protein